MQHICSDNCDHMTRLCVATVSGSRVRFAGNSAIETSGKVKSYFSHWGSDCNKSNVNMLWCLDFSLSLWRWLELLDGEFHGIKIISSVNLCFNRRRNSWRNNIFNNCNTIEVNRSVALSLHHRPTKRRVFHCYYCALCHSWSISPWI